MIVKEINLYQIEQNRFEVKTLLADGSVRGELFTEIDGIQVGERLENVVFESDWMPFELTEAELSELNHLTDAPQL